MCFSNTIDSNTERKSEIISDVKTENIDTRNSLSVPQAKENLESS